MQYRIGYVYWLENTIQYNYYIFLLITKTITTNATIRIYKTNYNYNEERTTTGKGKVIIPPCKAQYLKIHSSIIHP